MIYIKRKFYRLSIASLGKSVGDLSVMVSLLISLFGIKWKFKILSDGWGLSFEKVFFFIRVEMDKYIG